MLDSVWEVLEESIGSKSVPEIVHIVSGKVAQTESLLMELEDGDDNILFHMNTEERYVTISSE